jgi:hypothetical protein
MTRRALAAAFLAATLQSAHAAEVRIYAVFLCFPPNGNYTGQCQYVNSYPESFQTGEECQQYIDTHLSGGQKGRSWTGYFTCLSKTVSVWK